MNAYRVKTIMIQLSNLECESSFREIEKTDIFIEKDGEDITNLINMFYGCHYDILRTEIECLTKDGVEAKITGDDEYTVKVSKDTMLGLYRILCNVPYSHSGYEVYEGAKDGMKRAHEWVIKYGEYNHLDSRGTEEYNKNK